MRPVQLSLNAILGSAAYRRHPCVRYGDWPVRGTADPCRAVRHRGDPGGSECGEALLHSGHDLLAQFVCPQRVAGTEHLARADGVEEGE
jgi:hypothetical protein